MNNAADVGKIKSLTKVSFCFSTVRVNLTQKMQSTELFIELITENTNKVLL